MRSGVVLPSLILTVAVFAVLDRFQPRHKLFFPLMLLSAVMLVAARFCWQLDVAGKFSGPEALLQGHAVWHLLTALSLASMFFYYRSEAVTDSAAPALAKGFFAVFDRRVTGPS